MEIKGIIYDFDGVICDSVDVKTKAFAELYKPYGNDIENAVVAYHLQNGGISRFEKIRYYHEVLLSRNISENEIIELADQFANLVKEKVINSAYVSGAREFIEAKAEHKLQYVCTGTPEVEIVEIIEKRGLTHFFNSIYGAPKKKTEIIAMILKESALAPTDFLYLGDAMTDYEAAKQLNVPFIGVYSDTTTFPKGTKVVKNFMELDIN